jgi:sugar phosphate permease
VFGATWASYVGFYFCRKPFTAAKAVIGDETGWSATTLGNIWAVFLVAYPIGHFLAAYMGTRLGPRRNVLLGMALSVIVTVLMGIHLSVPGMMVLVGINGLAQATGWSGNVGTLAAWFHRGERGRVMGIWSNCFSVGALASGWLMAWVLSLRVPPPWRACFWLGGAVLAVAWSLFAWLQRNRPEDVGLEPIDEPADAIDAGSGLSRRAWINLLLVSAFYFFAKFIRYAIWSWAAYFLQRNFALSSARANLYATAFDVMGMPGAYIAGWLSDRVWQGRRGEVSVLMMLAMTAAAVLLVLFGNVSSAVFTVLLGLVGLTLYGPDSLLTGAGAMDIGSRRAATFVAALISAFGSLGAVVQELVIARSYDASHGALGPVFVFLFGSSALATLFCVLLARRRV